MLAGRSLGGEGRERDQADLDLVVEERAARPATVARGAVGASSFGKRNGSSPAPDSPACAGKLSPRADVVVAEVDGRPELAGRHGDARRAAPRRCAPERVVALGDGRAAMGSPAAEVDAVDAAVRRSP